MYRKISAYLSQWKSNPYRKPLVLQGARQVGKTYSVLEFGKDNYANVAYFNFENDTSLADIFEERLTPKDIIASLSQVAGVSITKENTLVVFDEVQLCERALTSLKYFCEDAPEYHIIALGSLLGVAVNREKFSFPVGKVDMKTMYPMDMEEFMIALGEEELVEKIKSCYEANEPMPAAFHASALSLYKLYLVVGGMPECVSHYIATKDFILVRYTQETLLAAYLNDMSKYNTGNEVKKTRLAYDSITVQLSKLNTRFQYKLVKKGGRAAEFENAIEWLSLSGITTQIFQAEQIKKPLDDYKNIDSFKIYMSDSGLLAAKKKIHPDEIIYGDDSLNDFKGGMTENFVCTHLIANGYTPYFWYSERTAEVDFIIQMEKDIIPVEVKAAENVQSKSLNTYIKAYNPSFAFKISTKNFGFENGKRSVPLYAVFCI